MSTSNFKPIQSVADFERFLVKSMQKNAFLATISRYIKKLPSDKLPTAGVGYDPTTEDVTLFYNLDFFSGLTEAEAEGVLHHEFYHVIWSHITSRRKNPHMWWNIATDLAINSIITQDQKGTLPKGCFIPGQRPAFSDGTGKVKCQRLTDDGKIEEYERDLTPEEKKMNEDFADMIVKFPHGAASEFYFDKIAQWAKENNTDGGGYMNSFDDHGDWEKIADGQKDLVAGKVRQILERAVNEADGRADGWGSMPQEVREEIRRMVNNSIDWRKVLKSYVGMLLRGNRRNSFKRINKKYPYIHPGVKRSYLPRIGIFIDQSGSVGDEHIERMFAALENLARKTTFDVFFFDTEVDQKNAFTWTKGRKSNPKRTRAGGTDFEAVTTFVNSSKNRGKWDGYIIMTDGECSKPSKSRIKRSWILVPGSKLYFETDEMQVTMSDSDKKKSRA